MNEPSEHTDGCADRTKGPSMNEEVNSPAGDGGEDRTAILRAIEHATHLLPSQGPLTVFVHHNTLHAFEELPFDEGVRRGGELYGCEPYLPEPRYWAKLDAGRIRPEDIDVVLSEQLAGAADERPGGLSSRFDIRRARLSLRMEPATSQELRWIEGETEALTRFADDVDPARAREMVARTRRWVGDDAVAASRVSGDAIAECLAGVDSVRRASLTEEEWTELTLRLLLRLAREQAGRFVGTARGGGLETTLRPRDLLCTAGARDPDALVHDVLIPFCAAFLDQGLSSWSMPGRESGFLRSFARIYGRTSFVSPAWLRPLPSRMPPLDGAADAILDSILGSLRALGVPRSSWESFLVQTVLALRGWAGMLWQVESQAEWLPERAPAGALLEFVCIRLVLDRLAAEHVARHDLRSGCSREELVCVVPREEAPPRIENLAFTAFSLAQRLGWSVDRLARRSDEEWDDLFREIEAFGGIDRRQVFHLAFERQYLRAALSAVYARAHTGGRRGPERPSFQIVCCIDEREESFRRAIEEVDTECETLGVAGFFGVAMYYRGATEAHFRPLCPVSVTPEHSIVEEPAYSFLELSRRRRTGQRRFGRLSHGFNVGSRTLWGGLFAGLGGAAAAVPLVGRILFPRSVAILRRVFGRLSNPPRTDLVLEAGVYSEAGVPAPIGYTSEEMAGVVGGTLRAMGLTPAHGFSSVVVVCGHGSASLNNPQEAAHDCGACGGGRGGPNARAFARMANDPKVRAILASQGFAIPEGVRFVGAYHNTCDDSLTWYDLDDLPRPSRPAFEHARAVLERARAKNARERCRRFESAPLTLDEAGALRHVEGRAEDLSQTRPEYGHATNALCLVGRREWSKGLFLDRRAFLTSYDPGQDDPRGTILEGLLRAVVPVCAGINLEYYFSYVDPTGYGCGTKLPHNISCLLGVMDGARSDLRTGLPWQMVEIHEPYRLLFVVETTEEVALRIFRENPPIARLVDGEWVHFAILDPQTRMVRRYRQGGFQVPEDLEEDLPTVPSSLAWYGGKRDHLGFARIEEGGEPWTRS